MAQLEITKKFEKSLTAIAKKDRELFAVVNEKIKLLGDGYLEQLTIKPILRKHARYKISEIIIKYPSSFRVFYVQLCIVDDTVLLVDCQRKKVQKFKPEYFEQLDKCIEEYVERRS